jgi:hypothetical protein
VTPEPAEPQPRPAQGGPLDAAEVRIEDVSDSLGPASDAAEPGEVRAVEQLAFS